MALNENLCWEIIRSLKGRAAYFKSSGEIKAPRLENAIPLHDLESHLALKYRKNQIEDCLYFLEKRRYLIKHGFMGFTLVVLQLSAQALKALENGSFSPEEQKVFKEALFDLKSPGIWGMKFNLGEALQRIKKKIQDFKPRD